MKINIAIGVAFLLESHGIISAYARDCSLRNTVNPNGNDGTITTLQVYGDFGEMGGIDSSVWYNTKELDPTPRTNTIISQGILKGINGCVGGDNVVAQRQGNQVCFAYQVR